MTRRKAVVTGIGVVAPGGVGTKAFWQLLTDGRTATRAISHFDASAYRSRIAAECDFDATAAGLTSEEVLRMDRAAQFAVVAAREALADSGAPTDGVEPHRIGVSIGSAVGNTITLEQQYVRVSARGSNWVVDPSNPYPHLYGALVPGSLATEVAWTAGAQGPVRVVSTGCTSGLDSVAQGAQFIEDGQADIVLAGATDAPISPITVACFDAIRATSPNNDDPEHASRPFDRDRDGFVLGEGAAVLVLEDEESARRRGARVYCEVAGYAQRSNAFHMTGLRPDGKELAEAVRVALDHARLPADAVDYVNAHGSGTRQNDKHETAAVKVSLGEHAYRVPMSSIKSMVGHSLGAIGALEVAACALAIEQDTIPPTANLHHVDPELGLDYVPLTAREQRTDTVLSVGSGFGGFQTAMVLTAPGKGARHV
ncbi:MULTISPECIES: beta-ketoacyl-[acyl-carrier-protein] synthase family protein [unclassified Streptomyces]|uniref:beta-ketoacyl-[acyl-carrier-protein] synthase family protein n=1 Tax=unclassified Streptomyces TaxID=2593676 RepID=UPI002E106ECE|nr:MULTISPECIES: beta-ketoacyl-[acyl-carrier-protein] synthase family protein [unclassified Streptomyces]WSR21662.1 beta-ketoacyl-[acyl-carrier-protein] synthase family protein [Streptomyces sp. NBC_01205]